VTTLERPDREPDYRLTLPNLAGWLSSNDSTGGRLYVMRAQKIWTWRTSAGWKAKHDKIPHLDRAHIVAVLSFGDARRRDPANWYPTAKACVDGLVDAGVLTDDSARYLTGPDMRLGPKSLHYLGSLSLDIYALPGER